MTEEAYPTKFVISCAGDTQLATKLNLYLSNLNNIDLIKLSIKEDELFIEIENEKEKQANKDLRSVIKGFLCSFVDSISKDQKYLLYDLDEIFVMGRDIDPEKLGLSRCSFCNFLFPSEEEMLLHERTHTYAAF